MCTDCLDRWGKVSNFAAQEKSERRKRKKKAQKESERKNEKKKRENEKEKREESERIKEKILVYGEFYKRAVRAVAYRAYASRQCVQRIAVVAVGEDAGGLVAVAYRGYRPAAVAA